MTQAQQAATLSRGFPVSAAGKRVPAPRLAPPVMAALADSIPLAVQMATTKAMACGRKITDKTIANIEKRETAIGARRANRINKSISPKAAAILNQNPAIARALASAAVVRDMGGISAFTRCR